MTMTGFVPTANIKRLSASLEKIISAYFVSQRDKMNISVSAAQSVSQSVSQSSAAALFSLELSIFPAFCKFFFVALIENMWAVFLIHDFF